MAWLSEEQLKCMSFQHLGKSVLISDKASIYNAEKISIGDNSRIDDFCIISASGDGVEIGSHVHIACYSSLIGSKKITLADFSGLSSRVSIYSSSDDYSGRYMTNPTVPTSYTNVTHKPVYVGRHCIIGAGSIILPGVILEEGVAIGALSLVTKKCLAFGIYSGSPAKRIIERKKQLLELESEFLSN